MIEPLFYRIRKKRIGNDDEFDIRASLLAFMIVTDLLVVVTVIVTYIAT